MLPKALCIANDGGSSSSSSSSSSTIFIGLQICKGSCTMLNIAPWKKYYNTSVSSNLSHTISGVSVVGESGVSAPGVSGITESSSPRSKLADGVYFFFLFLILILYPPPDPLLSPDKMSIPNADTGVLKRCKFIQISRSLL